MYSFQTPCFYLTTLPAPQKGTPLPFSITAETVVSRVTEALEVTAEALALTAI
jgi:hypothetical protein